MAEVAVWRGCYGAIEWQWRQRKETVDGLRWAGSGVAAVLKLKYKKLMLVNLRGVTDHPLRRRLGAPMWLCRRATAVVPPCRHFVTIR